MKKNYIITEDSLINGSGQSLYAYAKKVIPGGTQLLSKRPEMFAPIYGLHISQKPRL